MPDAGPGVSLGAKGCQPISLQQGVSVGGYNSDQFSWWDAQCQIRTASLVRNDAADPGGSNGGFLRAYSYAVDGGTLTAQGPANAPNWNGWGYVVNHFGNGDVTSRGVTGTYRTVFAGRHHAIHEFKYRLTASGPFDVTIHWMFATGRSHPVYAITHDSSPAGPDVNNADARAPYGNLTFDGIPDDSGQVAGDAWGDHYRFTKTGPGPVTFNSDWDYTTPNLVPFALEWAAAVDAEMGIVQTVPWTVHGAGGDYGGGILANCWGHTSASPGQCLLQNNSDKMPQDWLWPFQLNQWELPYVTTSKRLAWGMTYGAVGQRSFTAFGNGYSGYPYQSYSVFLVLGPHSEGGVMAQVADVESAAGTTLTATVGTVETSGPGGPGRTDAVVYSPAGYDPIYASWVLRAASNAVSFRLDPGHGTLSHPLFQILGWTAAAPPSHVTLNGATLTSDSDAFMSVDPNTQTLWLTLNQTVAAPIDVSVSP